MGISNKVYADRYISENFLRLSNEVIKWNNSMDDKCMCSIDRLNDVCVSLYSITREFESYKAFEQMAENLIRCTKKAHHKPKNNNRKYRDYMSQE